MDRAAVGSTSLLMALLADGVAEGLLGGAMGMPWFGALAVREDFRSRSPTCSHT